MLPSSFDTQCMHSEGGKEVLGLALGIILVALLNLSFLFCRVTLAALTTWPTSTTSTMLWSSTLCCG